GERGYSAMLSAVGVGALTGALLVASFPSPRSQHFLLGAGAALIVLGLEGLAFARQLELAVACSAVGGAGLILFFATGQPVLRVGSEDHNRGRIMGIWLMVLAGTQPAGHWLAGLAADTWGVPAVLIAQGLGILLVTVAASLLLLSKRFHPLHA